MAARFAAKEAIGKLIGEGVLSWQEIELVGEAPPRPVLRGGTAALARARGVGGLQVSLSHVDTLAGACVVAVATGEGGVAMGHPAWELQGFARGGPAPGCSDALQGSTSAASLVSFHPLGTRSAVFTPAQVRELDRMTIEDVGLPGAVLMERAALGVSTLVQSRFPDRHTLIVCGPGNNGGDGLAAARQLHLAGHPVACVVTVSSASELTADAALNLRAAQKAGVNLRLAEVPDYLWDETELVVDCLLGTGARGEMRGRMGEWARPRNPARAPGGPGRAGVVPTGVGAGTRGRARGVPVRAVDVPSGVDAGTGSKAKDAVAADLTITFHAAKSGLVCPPGSEAAGEVLVWDIGLPGFLEPEPDLWVVGADDVNIPGRRVDDHKYRAGYVAVLAGSKAYPGAAWLASQAALYTGAGYVRLLLDSGSADALRGRLVEVVLEEIGSGDRLSDATRALACLADERLGAAVVGPGLGRAEETLQAVRLVVQESRVPMVLDADGLLAFAGRCEQLASRPGLVLTPHVGELAALLEIPAADVVAASLPAARGAAERTGQVVLLKGSSTVVAAPTGQARVIVQGPPQLASAGTGDVLAGIVGALLAKGLEPFEAAYAGAWLHAEAGRREAERDPQGIRAGSLVEALPEVIAECIYERGPSWTS